VQVKRIHLDSKPAPIKIQLRVGSREFDRPTDNYLIFQLSTNGFGVLEHATRDRSLYTMLQAHHLRDKFLETCQLLSSKGIIESREES
jgi:hypothetical protein